MQAKFLSWSGDSIKPNTPLYMALLGSNLMTLATLTTAQSLIKGAYNNEVAADTIAAAVVDAAYQSISTNGGNTGSDAMSDARKLVELFGVSYKKAMPLAARRRLEATANYPTADQLQPLFVAVSEVRGVYGDCCL
jgi:hypothetical protein